MVSAESPPLTRRSVRDSDTHVGDGLPWLRVETLERFAGAWVTVVYRASLWDVPVRPLFRFMAGEAILDEVVAPAPLEATAFWTGRIPAGTTRALVSPTDRAGPFGFRVESIRERSWLALLTRGFRRAPRPARSALLTRLIGWAPEADNNLAWAIGATPFDEIDGWTRARARAPELEGIDRPRADWPAAPPLRVVIAAGGADAAALGRTLESLDRQLFTRWTALVVDAASPQPGADRRVVYLRSAAEAAALVAYDDLWFACVPAGVAFRPEALAIVVERRAVEADATIVYGDEIGGDGRPLLKPGWSPRLAAALPFLGRAVFAAPSLLGRDALVRLIDGGEWIVPAGTVPIALRRLLLTRARTRRAPQLARPTGAPDAVPDPARPVRARTAVIVLTRDQPALLARLVASVRARSTPGSYRLVVVDNGDGDGPAETVLAALTAAADATVLRRPGPFNFSALCNEAAAAATEEVLLFLNDDTEVLGAGWLDRLARLATEPGVGAVGARLTYPDGRLQHVGVLAGMGGSAGHFGAPAPGDDPGWAGRNRHAHEVSAVTGACLAVTREKFEAVGGFDAEHLPVELSDIDLCFKLNARGWQTLVDPAVHLLHEESFSRGGATFRRLGKYGEQRAIFVARWRHVLRDDPVFHPALSLYSWGAALG